MSSLQERIAGLIAASGPITVAQYMTIALHDPDNGYYSKPEPIGARGAFITAPEISQMFGELIGLWCAQVWLDQGKPERPQLVELGPGRGTLMADALRALRVVPEFLSTTRATLVEASPSLSERQQEALKDSPIAVKWLSRFDGSGMDGPLFLIANEFFDALPIRQFVRTERGWNERVVCAQADGALSFALSPALANDFVPTDRAMAPLGAVFEICEPARAVAEEVGREIGIRGGGALIIDYGYDTPGVGETLQAVSNHRYANILEQPGRTDLSAHVDFRALAEAASRSETRVYGPVGQGAFLSSIGIVERAKRLANEGDRDVMTALERLTNPDQMGKLFKVLGIVPRHAARPPGFEQ